MNVALLGGLGTASGQTYLAFVGDLLHWTPLQVLAFFVGTAIVAWLAWRFVEPFFSGLFLTGHLVTASRHPPRSLNLRRYARIFVVVLTTAVFAESLVHSLTHEMGRLVEWVTTVVMYGLVTYGWTVGAARRPPRAGRWGALVGALVGMVVSGVVGVIAFRLKAGGIFPPGRPPSPVSVAGYAAGGAVSMSIRGFAGGKAVELGGRLPVGVRVMVGVGLLAVLQGGVVAVLGLPGWPSLVVSLVVEAIGWGMGLSLYPDSDAVLGTAAGELPRAHVPAPPVQSPAPAASEKPRASGAEVTSDASERRGRISVALAGGIGAASGIAYYLFVEDIRGWTTTRIALFFLITALVAWIAWRFFEPFFASVLMRGRLPGAPGRGHHRRLGMAFLAVLTSAVTLEVLFHSLMIRGGQGFLLWLGAVVMFTVITYAWTRAARRRPARAGRAGALAGALVGAGTLGSMGVFVGGGTVFPEAQALGASTEPGLVDVISLIFSGLVTMAPRGYGGGKAIDLGGRLPVGIRVMLGVSAIVAAQIVVDQVTMAASGIRVSSPYAVWALEAIGWGVGILLCPYSESVLGSGRFAA